MRGEKYVIYTIKFITAFTLVIITKVKAVQFSHGLHTIGGLKPFLRDSNDKDPGSQVG